MLIEKTDFSKSPPPQREYEGDTFRYCNFSGADLSGILFTECVFLECNLSLARLDKTAFRDVAFKDCKMLGLRFDLCQSLGLSFGFDGCILNHASFCRLKIKNTPFKNSQLQEADFSEADLTGSDFENSDLSRALFVHTVLEKVDFRTASHYSIDPEYNRIRKAKFSIHGVGGLLEKYDITIE